MKAEVTVLQGRRTGEHFPVQTNQKLLFGRDINCDVQLFDEGVSRRHFTVEGKGNSFLLVDVGSSNGTFVNGQRTSTKILRNGDVVRAGDCHFRFNYVGSQVETNPSVKIDESVGTFTPAVSKKFDIDSLGVGIGADGEAKPFLDALKALYRIGETIHAEDDLDTLFNTIMDLTLQVVHADRGYIVMYHPEDGSFDAVVVRRNDDTPEAADETLTLSRTVLNEAVRKGHAVLSDDTARDDRFKAGKSIIMQGIRSVVCVPLSSRDEVIGAIYLDNLGGPDGEERVFSEHDLELVAAIGKQAGIAIQRAKLFEDLEDLFYGTIKALVATVEAKDKYTHGHSERVTKFAMAIAEDMRLSPEMLDTIRLGALLHDIGKIAVPERILNKPSRLTEAEFTIIKNHPVTGYEILQHIAGIEPVLMAVRHHHEKMNGTGYPDGLAGEDIPLQARVVAVADAFDAMTSSRPYRRNFSIDEVIEEFERCAGDHFDPIATEHFIKLLKSGKIRPHLSTPTTPRTGAHNAAAIAAAAKAAADNVEGSGAKPPASTPLGGVNTRFMTPPEPKPPASTE